MWENVIITLGYYDNLIICTSNSIKTFVTRTKCIRFKKYFQIANNITITYAGHGNLNYADFFKNHFGDKFTRTLLLRIGLFIVLPSISCIRETRIRENKFEVYNLYIVHVIK